MLTPYLHLPAKCVGMMILLLTFFGPRANAQTEKKTQNVFIITLDGLRWQELFTGADSLLIAHPDYVNDTTELKELFGRSTPGERRQTLMPFFTGVLASQGQLYGNRQDSSKVNLTNSFWFSYPGYNEILTGYGDSRIDSNDKNPNPNRTILEVINEQPGFAGKVAAFASWDVFPFIINEERSGVPVNAGYETARGDSLSPMEKAINTLQAVVPGHWSTVRMDAFTHHYALEYIEREQPRVVYISYGETDDFAHDGRYDEYLKAAHRTDQFIGELWEYVQSHEAYRDKTTFIITTDHGRGTDPLDTWRSHGEEIAGADEVWLAALGPDTPSLPRELIRGQYFTNQIAATVAALLSVPYDPDHPAGKQLFQAINPTSTQTR